MSRKKNTPAVEQATAPSTAVVESVLEESLDAALNQIAESIPAAEEAAMLVETVKQNTDDPAIVATAEADAAIIVAETAAPVEAAPPADVAPVAEETPPPAPFADPITIDYTRRMDVDVSLVMNRPAVAVVEKPSFRKMVNAAFALAEADGELDDDAAAALEDEVRVKFDAALAAWQLNQTPMGALFETIVNPGYRRYMALNYAMTQELAAVRAALPEGHVLNMFPKGRAGWDVITAEQDAELRKLAITPPAASEKKTRAPRGEGTRKPAGGDKKPKWTYSGVTSFVDDIMAYIASPKGLNQDQAVLAMRYDETNRFFILQSDGSVLPAKYNEAKNEFVPTGLPAIESLGLATKTDVAKGGMGCPNGSSVGQLLGMLLFDHKKGNVPMSWRNQVCMDRSLGKAFGWYGLERGDLIMLVDENKPAPAAPVAAAK